MPKPRKPSDCVTQLQFTKAYNWTKKNKKILLDELPLIVDQINAANLGFTISRSSVLTILKDLNIDYKNKKIKKNVLVCSDIHSLAKILQNLIEVVGAHEQMSPRHMQTLKDMTAPCIQSPAKPDSKETKSVLADQQQN